MVRINTRHVAITVIWMRPLLLSLEDTALSMLLNSRSCRET
jgi:hypothetical protein